MTASADALYLPVLAPVKIEVGSQLARERAPQHPWRQRLQQQIPIRPRPVQGAAYGPDGRPTGTRQTGRLIDVFA